MSNYRPAGANPCRVFAFPAPTLERGQPCSPQHFAEVGPTNSQAHNGRLAIRHHPNRDDLHSSRFVTVCNSLGFTAMPFKPGQSGNPAGRSSERQWEHAIRAAGNVIDPKLKRRRMELAAEQVWLAAMAGDMAACNHVADRLDGKPHQTSDVNVNRKNVTQMTREELMAIAAGEPEDAEAEATTH